jgi:hypothetical protein
MTAFLAPLAGHPFLDPEEVVRRLEGEFEVCEVDEDAAQEAVGDMLAKLFELKAPQHLIDEVLRERERTKLVLIADHPSTEDYLQFMVRPNDRLIIPHYSGQHEAATRPLLKRCARVLAYGIEGEDDE